MSHEYRYIVYNMQCSLISFSFNLDIVIEIIVLQLLLFGTEVDMVL